MGMLSKIKTWWFERALRKQMASRKRLPTHDPVNLTTAASVGLYFNASDVDERKVVLQFAKQLRDQGKKVRLLGCFDYPITDAEFSFPGFARQETNWFGQPTSAKVAEFLAEPLELFIGLQAQTDSLLEYVASLTNAYLKVGPLSERLESFDLMLDFPARIDHRQLIQQIQQILRITNVRETVAA